MKKKKMRRGLSLLLAVLIAGVCLLSGCGAQRNEAQEDAACADVKVISIARTDKEEEDETAEESAGESAETGDETTDGE